MSAAVALEALQWRRALQQLPWRGVGTISGLRGIVSCSAWQVLEPRGWRSVHSTPPPVAPLLGLRPQTRAAPSAVYPTSCRTLVASTESRVEELRLDSAAQGNSSAVDTPPNEKEQEELLLHFCIGLRKALVASQPLQTATLLPILKALRDATPKGFNSYSATFLDYAFWQEMEQIAEAAQLSKEGAKIAHEELVAVCVGAADAGLVHLNTPIALSRQAPSLLCLGRYFWSLP